MRITFRFRGQILQPSSTFPGSSTSTEKFSGQRSETLKQYLQSVAQVQLDGDTIGSIATALALARGLQTELAVELSERARCLVLGQVERYRSQPAKLSALDSRLAQRFADLNKKITQTIFVSFFDPNIHEMLLDEKLSL